MHYKNILVIAKNIGLIRLRIPQCIALFPFSTINFAIIFFARVCEEDCVSEFDPEFNLVGLAQLRVGSGPKGAGVQEFAHECKAKM